MFTQSGTPSPSTRQVFARDIDPVDLEIGPGGDLFLVDFTGSIRRYTYTPSNNPPTAVVQGSPTTGPVPLAVNFDGTGSSDPDPGDTLTYAWDLNGDGVYDDSTAAKPTRTYTSPGHVTVRLRVTDSRGASDTASGAINPANQPPQVSIDQPSPALTWKVGDTVNFSGTATDPDDGALAADRLSWTLTLKHCTTAGNCHAHPLQSWDGVASGSFVTPDHDYPSHLDLTLTATDSVGATDTETVVLDPRTVDLTFRTNPSGLQLAVGASHNARPITRTVIVGSTNSITALSPQALNSTPYRFVSWSDGGARAHDIVAKVAPATYTATYAPSGRNCRGQVKLRHRGHRASHIHVRNIRCKRARHIIKASAAKLGWKCVLVRHFPHSAASVIRCERRSKVIRFWHWRT